MSEIIIILLFIASCVISFLSGMRFVMRAVTLYARDGDLMPIYGSKYRVKKEGR